MSILFNAFLKLNDVDLGGPVKHNPQDNTFLFVNRHNSHDIYIQLSKDNRGNWYKSGGPNLSFPKEFIDDLGKQIDEHLNK